MKIFRNLFQHPKKQNKFNPTFIIKKLQEREHSPLTLEQFIEIFNFDVSKKHKNLEENVALAFDMIDEQGNKSSVINDMEIKETISVYQLNFTDDDISFMMNQRGQQREQISRKELIDFFSQHAQQ